MSISDNVSRVEQQIAAACRSANRARNQVRLMAVSKTHPPEAILEAYAVGLRLFGENRVQEYAGKQITLDTSGIFSAQPGAEFHLIGPLQTNKIARAAYLFSGIDTVDSLRMAERLNSAAEACEKTISICVEIKLSPEETKHGLAPDSGELSQLLERLADFPHLQMRGLMSVPPYAEDPEQARPYFRQLRTLRNSLAQRYPRLSLDELTMGMSHDFSVAIEEGATLIRVGTAIFGQRPIQK
jgi:pyridoxal phosphate enzyme (YggS family)